jgi:type II secretory pathway pseudopilin PulG
MEVFMIRRDNLQQSRAGIATVLPLVVIAIIAILIGLLLPAVQKVRENSNAGTASRTLVQVCQAAQTYRSTNSAYPSSLLELGSLINDPTLLLTGTEDGYQFTITQATSTAWAAQAAPVMPGVTGSDEFIVDQTCAEQDVSLPGATVQRQLMFSAILAAGAEAMGGLLSSNPDVPSQVKSFVDSSSTTPMVSQMVSAQTSSGSHVSFSSILHADQNSEPLRQFLAFLPQAMHLGAGNEDVTSLPGVQLTDLSGPLRTRLLSSQGLCGLTQLYETNPAVSHSFCATLSLAQAAEDRGDVQAKAAALSAYRQAVEAQTGKTLTAHQASLLITLVAAL